MDTDEQPEVHVSIQKGFSFPALQKCKDCCTPAKFHCPFCLPTFYKPTKYSKAMIHLENHLKRAIFIGEYTIHKCALGCRTQAHYHCLYCRATLMKNHFTTHLSWCLKSQQGRGQNLSNMQESDGNRDNIIILNSGERGEEASSSSSQSVVPIAMMSADQGSSKCDRSVQTNFEKPQDCDEFYFMSLVKLFKKLSPQKKADVRMKIERLLFEAEFE
ncbi:uncharacterized protein LOC104930532 isoform X1 [Larimichthys crocea]|uniref:uncharacterized protein LOC104930532 isoform X1 n=2 Tax=Larimichthys crocea TaxID=215358 RepID=UPI00054B84D7|nr:uncharacterized protein LOC104930532 isoform X1 [Larimichthys crocea]